MSNKKEEQWKNWLKNTKSKGYSTENIKKELRAQGYSEGEISKVMNIESSQQKRTIYTIILICIIAAGALIWISTFQKTAPETSLTSQEIFKEITFSGITADTITQEERTQLLQDLDKAINQQCSAITVPSDTCSPYTIYSFVEARKKLGISEQEAHTAVSSAALELWKEYYKQAEFNKEGSVTGESQLSTDSINQYHYFIMLMPEQERQGWLEKISGMSPTNLLRRFFLVKTYADHFGVTVSQIPEESMSQETKDNLCSNIPTMQEWNLCGLNYYLQINHYFCEQPITQQEMSTAQQMLEMETQDPILQNCQQELRNTIS